jgi:Putative Zn-dependent protease, contains TPR repeats
MKKLLLILLTQLFFVTVQAQQEDVLKYIRSGNELYKQQKYEQAVAEYAKALALEPGNTTARFNQANALYRAGKQVDATQSFTELSTAVSEKNLRSKIYYNKGVILSKQKNLEESIEAYKNALRQNPSDKEARENLQKALLELKKKTPPDKDKKDKKQNKDQQQQKQPQSKLNQREAEQRLNLLAQKEKEVQQRLQKEKAKGGGGTGKDW